MIEPKLRFKADDGSDFPDWEEKKFLDCISKIVDFRGRTPLKLGMAWSGEKTEYLALSALNVKMGYIDENIDAHYGNKKLYDMWMDGNELYKGQVLFTTEAPMGNVAQVPDNKPYILSQRTIAFVPKYDLLHDDFLVVLLSSSNVQRRLDTLATGGTAKGISQKSLKNFNVKIPCDLDEQQKIADFLSTIDTIIEKQRATVSAWEERKKGVMQKLFSQEVRFKADDGSDFPDWEECTVGELFVPVVKKNKDGSIQNVITNSAEYGLIPQRDFFDKDIAIKENTSNYTIIQNGDFVYNPRKSTTAPFGPFNIYERDEAGIVSPLYTCLTPKYKEMTPYLSWYFRTNKWHPYIVTHGAQSGARHDRVGMTATLMNGIPVIYPSLPEQQKIADCLSALDAVIEQQKETLEKWQELKKGLLQQMFV